jgi:hypothetical protein
MVVLGAGGAGAPEGHRVVLLRKFAVGDVLKVRLVAEHEESTADAMAPEKPLQSASEKWGLTGEMKVEGVNDKGEPQRFVLTVEKFQDGKGADVVPTGEEMRVERGDKETTGTGKDGKVMGEDVLRVLRVMFSPLPKTGTNDEEVWGSRVPRRAGEAWKMDAEALARSWRGMGWKIDASALSGGTTITGIEEREGRKAMRVVVNFELGGGTPPGVPAEMRIETIEGSGTTKLLLPLDVEALPLEREMMRRMNVVFGPVGGGGPKWVMTQRDTLKEVYERRK